MKRGKITQLIADAIIGAQFGLLVHYHCWGILTALAVFMIIRRLP